MKSDATFFDQICPVQSGRVSVREYHVGIVWLLLEATIILSCRPMSLPSQVNWLRKQNQNLAATVLAKWARAIQCVPSESFLGMTIDWV